MTGSIAWTGREYQPMRTHVRATRLKREFIKDVTNIGTEGYLRSRYNSQIIWISFWIYLLSVLCVLKTAGKSSHGPLSLSLYIYIYVNLF